MPEPDVPENGEAPGEERPTIYAVRLSVQADQDVVEATVRLAELTEDVGLAKEWSDDFLQGVGALATNPRRYPVAQRESRLLGRETRQMLYRRTASSVAYRVFYTAADIGVDGPTVTIVHVRHGGRRSLTREEARRIIANQ